MFNYMGEQKENKTKYLYGASVQGIQDFIFQTNKLKEIVGASELVANICTDAFNDFEPMMVDNQARKEKSIVRAAGNIKYIFEEREDCEKAVKDFPRKVMTMAPGITISQAVVKYPTQEIADFSAAVNQLERNLRTQRNKPVRSMTLGLIATRRSPATGLPAVTDKNQENQEELLDEGSLLKRNAEKSMNDSIAIKAFPDGVVEARSDDSDGNLWRNFEDDIDSKNDWIAVIHADGNGMGNIFERIGHDVNALRDFSQNVDELSKQAARAAFEAVRKNFDEKKIIPIRPIVLSGDDFAVICRADFAVQYAASFIENFEGKATAITGENLTACAGIAFVKSSYPFHYAIHLAESLCVRAKNAAKGLSKESEKLPPSCLMFHKVQDSFIEDFEEIVQRELTPQPNHLSFEYGPYYCGSHAKDLPSVRQIEAEMEKLNSKEGNAVRSHLREWLNMLFENVGAADQKMKRLKAVNELAGKNIDKKYENLESSGKVCIPYYDILSLHSVTYTETKKK